MLQFPNWINQDVEIVGRLGVRHLLGVLAKRQDENLPQIASRQGNTLNLLPNLRAPHRPPAR
jgi:hypothetical protein